MSHDPVRPATSPAPMPGPWPGPRLVADHWGVVLAYGVATLVLGVILAVWPGETLKVCVVLLAIQILLSGVVRLVTAVAASSTDPSIRSLVGLSGALGIIVGLLVLRDPLQTLLVIGLILGVWWVVSGLIDIIGALIAAVPGRRGWDIAAGLVTVGVGGFLLVSPDLSLTVLVVVACTWLIAIGLIAVLTALRMRSAARSAAPAPVAPGVTTSPG